MNSFTHHPNCVLCQLVTGQLPYKKVLESDEFLAIYDKYPRAPIHVLIIDKKHREKKDTLLTGKYNSQHYWDNFFTFVAKVIKHLHLDQKGFKIEILGAGYNHFEHEHVHVLSGF